jgi:quercetin dioxygenase-like cupin family protein
MPRQKSVKERKIDAPTLALQVDEEVRRLKTEPEWKSGVEDGITLAKYPHMRVVLVALKRGIRMKEHAVKGPMSLFVVSGKVTLIVEKQEFQLKEKGLFTLRKAVLHDVMANSDAVILMTIMAL